MKSVLTLIIILISSFAWAQQPTQNKAKYDTLPPIELNKLEQRRLDDVEARRQKAINEMNAQFNKEQSFIIAGILESNNIDPNHIEGDSLKISFEPGKILLYRKVPPKGKEVEKSKKDKKKE